jgi:hypothetical protein
VSDTFSSRRALASYRRIASASSPTSCRTRGMTSVP